MSWAVILSSGSYLRHPPTKLKNAADSCNSCARSGGINTDIGSLREKRGTDRNASNEGGGDGNAPTPPPPPGAPASTVAENPTATPPLAGVVEDAGVPAVVAAATAAVAEVASGYSPLLRLPPLSEAALRPLVLVTPLWNELICGQTSFTRFQ